jgi:HEPN domain-containing protein
MDRKEELVRKWLEKANIDLITAERLLTFEEPTIESICFHCQQVVEKYIKAFLILANKDFKKTHEIDYLNKYKKLNLLLISLWKLDILKLYMEKYR